VLALGNKHWESNVAMGPLGEMCLNFETTQQDKDAATSSCSIDEGIHFQRAKRMYRTNTVYRERLTGKFISYA
jgi:hypothetical protein